MKYSTIIPVYNSERTLRRCLDSLLSQARDDVEVFLIDDGSADRSVSICREYERRDARVRVLTKAHTGVSAARNLGLENAVGEYILFVDSDDYVEPDYFEKLDCILADGQPELVFLSYRLVGGQTSTVRTPDMKLVPTADIAELVASLLRKQQLNALWSKVFLRSVIESCHLRFDENLDIDEDVNFIFAYVLRIERIRTSGEALYNVSLENLESLTRRKRDYLCEQLHRAGLNRKSILDASSLIPQSKKTVGKALDWLYYRGAYSSAAELFKYPLNSRERRVRIHEICRVFSGRGAGALSLTGPMISLPIRFHMTWLIDRAAKTAVQRRKL